MMKILFLIAVFAMGIYDGGDITASLVLLLIFAPSIFERKKKEADKAGVLSQHAGDVLVTEACEMREHFTVKEKPIEGFDLKPTLTTSRGLSGDKTYIYYSGKGGVCQEGRQDNPSTVFDGPPSWCSGRAL